MRKVVFLSFVYFLLLSIDGLAQSSGKLRWTTDSDALPQNSIKSIAPDKYGFLWLCTENGLVRYDGQEFKVFNSINTGFQNNRFVAISGDWEADSLYTYNDYQNDVVLINRRSVNIIKGRQRLKSNPPGIDRNRPFVSQGVPSMLFDVPKRPYIIPLNDREYYLIAAGRISHFTSSNKLISTTAFHYQNNSSFFLVGNTLFHIKKDGRYSRIQDGKVIDGTLNITAGKPLSMYWNVVTKQVFCYVDKNLYELKNQNGTLVLNMIIPDQDLSAFDISCIYYDSHDGIVFLGSFKNGLGTYRTDRFRTLSRQSGSQAIPEIFYAIEPFSSELAVSAKGLIMNQNSIVADLNLTADNFDIALDHEGDIWVSNLAYLHRYTKSSGYKKSRKWHFPHGITTILKGIDNTMWFTTNTLNDEGATLYRFESGEDPQFEKVTDINTKVNYLTQYDNSGIWLATRLGLKYYNLQNKTIRHHTNTTDLNIRSIYMPDQDNIWLMTYEKGFFLLQDDKLTSFPADKNSYLLSSHCIVEDKKGYFWLTTNKGLFQVRKQNLLSYALNKNTPIYYHYYNKDYGFLSNEFNGGCQPCGITLPNDVVFFPSIKGAVTFNPAEISPALPDNSIFLDQVLIDGIPVAINDTINLDRNFDRATFYVTSPYYGHRLNLNYEVMLRGQEDQDWLPFANYNNISFTKLPPGFYTVSIRKQSGFDGDYSQKTIYLNIKPAFWQTRWFSIFAALVIFILILLFYRIRTNFIRRRNIDLERFVNERTSDLRETITTLRTTRENLNTQIDNNTKIIQYITHDIKSPLKFMAMAGKHMYETFNEKQEDLRENLKAIYTSSNQMYNFVSNLLEYSKAYLDGGEKGNTPFNLYDLVAEKTAIFESIALSQRTVIRNVIPQHIALSKNRQLFAIIIHNLLDNATKNTLHGKIMNTGFMVGNQTHIVISDTGRGMTDETLTRYRKLIADPDSYDRDGASLGLHIVIELMVILNGKMKIDSKENVGTTVTLIFNNIVS